MEATKVFTSSVFCNPGMCFMDHNRELQLAWEYAEHTGISIFLTGKAGTGKTTFLRTLRAKSAKSMIVVAPTGVAAINAGGMTIHSFFQLPTAPYVPGSDYKDKFNFSKQKLRIIRSLDMLVIDEISMVRADLLDAVDNALRKYRRSSAPFGGVQLLMIGDLQQLAPVVTHADEALLRDHYDTNYFFGSKALARIPYVTIALSKVYRQQNEQFISLLNHVRDNRLTQADVGLLNSRLNPAFRPDADAGYIRLTTHNATADNFNNSELAALPGKTHTFRAKISGVFPEYAYPTAPELTLKVGAQVMFVKNDTSAERQYYNGKIGIVDEISAGEVRVRCEGDDELIKVTPQSWDNMKYTVDEQTNTVVSESQGSFSQIPLRLAWAITIHKSQGLTFDRVIIDAGRSFAPGQVYVALSRCRTLEGIVLSTPIGVGRLGGDPEVAAYISNQKEEAQRSFEVLSDIKQTYFRNSLIELFRFAEIAAKQQSVAQLLARTFRHSYPDETAAQALISTRLHEKIIDVADKWIAQISIIPFVQLASEQFNGRIKSASEYFGAQLGEVFGTSLKSLKRVKTGDKKASQRIKELTDELADLLAKKLYTLSGIASTGFTLHGYLHLRRQAELRPAQSTQSARTERSKSKRATKSSSSSKSSSY